MQKECCLTSDEEDNGASTEISSRTISKYSNFFRYIFDQLNFCDIFFFREIIGDYLINNRKGKKIGGVGMHVEIDESLFGKR